MGDSLGIQECIILFNQNHRSGNDTKFTTDSIMLASKGFNNSAKTRPKLLGSRSVGSYRMKKVDPSGKERDTESQRSSLKFDHRK